MHSLAEKPEVVPVAGESPLWVCVAAETRRITGALLLTKAQLGELVNDEVFEQVDTPQVVDLDGKFQELYQKLTDKIEKPREASHSELLSKLIASKGKTLPGCVRAWVNPDLDGLPLCIFVKGSLLNARAKVEPHNVIKAIGGNPENTGWKQNAKTGMWGHSDRKDTYRLKYNSDGQGFFVRVLDDSTMDDAHLPMGDPRLSAWMLTQFAWHGEGYLVDALLTAVTFGNTTKFEAIANFILSFMVAELPSEEAEEAE
jgi:hypothetical protein